MKATLKQAIKKTVTENSLKWKATKVWSIGVNRSYSDEEAGTGEMIISVQVKLKTKKK